VLRRFVATEQLVLMTQLVLTTRGKPRRYAIRAVGREAIHAVGQLTPEP
jgi:hypothetical protein